MFQIMKHVIIKCKFPHKRMLSVMTSFHVLAQELVAWIGQARKTHLGPDVPGLKIPDLMAYQEQCIDST